MFAVPGCFLAANSTGASKISALECALGIQPAKVCGGSPMVNSVSLATLGDSDSSEGGRALLQK